LNNKIAAAWEFDSMTLCSGSAAAPARHRYPTAPPRPGPPAVLVRLGAPPPAPRPPSPPALERLCRCNTVITT